MARKFLTAIDLGKNELQNAAVQNLGSAPSSPVKGQLYYNSTGGDDTLYWWNGSQWMAAKAAAGATPAATVTVSAVGDASVVGISTNFAREDHKHGRESFGVITAQTSFGAAKADGAATTLARSDHTHGTPVHDNTAHATINLSALNVPTSDIVMNGFKVVGLGAPTSGADAATKTYVDGVATGMTWKSAARAATTTNGTLASAYQNGSVIDGVTLATGDRILIKNQTTQTENGIYTVNASGAPTRATDADAGTELVDAAVFIAEGTTNADTAWVQTTNAPITLGGTNLVFVQFSGAGAYVAGAGLTQSGTTFNVGAGTGITVNADDVAVALDGVDNTRLANMAASTFKGRVTASTGDPEDMTAAQATSLLNTFTTTLKGLVPAPSTTTGKFLKDDGTWATAGTINKFAQGCAAATSTTVTHNLNSQDVQVTVYLNSGTFEEVDADIEHTSVNVVTVRFATAPAANAYRIVVVG